MNIDPVQLLNTALNIRKTENNKAYSRSMIERVRQMLNNNKALDKSKIYTYRQKEKCPQAMIEGFALGLISSQTEKTINTKIHADSSQSEFQKSFKVTGMYFDSVKFIIKLRRSKSNSKMLSASFETIYKGANLHPLFLHNILNLEFISDSIKANEVEDIIETSGPGVKIEKQNTKFSVKKMNLETGATQNQIETKHQLYFSNKASKDTEVKVIRSTENSFLLNSIENENTLEKSTFTLRRPSKKLILEIHFEEEIFYNSKDFNIDVIAFPSYLSPSMNTEEDKTALFLLGNNTLTPIGTRSWRWESIDPPVTGTRYGLQYSVKEIEKCLK